MTASRTTAGPPPLAFLSYARADIAIVRDLARHLRACGMRTWVDVENLEPGEAWEQAVATAMAGADIFVPCMSGASLKSRWTGLELDRALSHGVQVVPILLEAQALPMLPERLRALHHLQIDGQDGGASIVRAARKLAARTGVQPATTRGAGVLGIAGLEGAPGDLTDAAAFIAARDAAISATRFAGAADLDGLDATLGHARAVVVSVDAACAAATCTLVLGFLCARFSRDSIVLLIDASAVEVLAIADDLGVRYALHDAAADDAGDIVVADIARTLHENWRTTHKRQYGGEPRWRVATAVDGDWLERHQDLLRAILRRTDDGKMEIDISSLAPDQLPESLTRENLAAARAAVASLATFPGDDIEAHAARTHAQWLVRNPLTAAPEQRLTYARLSEDEKEKDRAVIRIAAEGLGRKAT